MSFDWRKSLWSIAGEISKFDVVRRSHRTEIPPLTKFFRPTYHAIRNLDLEQIYLAEPKSFNDPMDSRMALSKHQIHESYFSYLCSSVPLQKELDNLSGSWRSCSLRDIENIRDKSDHVLEYLRQLENAFNSEEYFDKFLKTRDFYRIACFSEEGDSALMWGHYTDNHKGFAVQYVFSELNEPLFNHIYPVLYSQEPYKPNTIKYIIQRIDDYERGNLDRQYIDAIYEGVAAAVIKSDEWCYEREWRFVLPKIAVDDYGFNNFQAPIPKKCLNCIILGVNTDEIIKKHLSDIARRLDVCLCEAKFEKDNYKMKICDIDYLT